VGGYISEDVENIGHCHSEFCGHGFLQWFSQVKFECFGEFIDIVFDKVVEFPHLFLTEGNRTSCTSIEESTLSSDNLPLTYDNSGANGGGKSTLGMSVRGVAWMVDDLSLRKDDMVAVVTWVVVAITVGKAVDGGEDG
jgi:hypothetical protein